LAGPGPALTARDQGQLLFEALGLEPQFREVPVGLLNGIVAVTATLGKIIPKLAEKADLARIGRYYATESMLVWDKTTGRYDADATPSTGSDTLFDFYAALIRGEASVDRGDHAVF
jgi:divinyl chlorophyllide a 8-vinyl-reductase